MEFAEKRNLSKRIVLRVFPEEYKRLKRVLNKAVDSDGFRKYDNFSHLVRCAIMLLINKENKLLKKTGRPRKSKS